MCLKGDLGDPVTKNGVSFRAVQHEIYSLSVGHITSTQFVLRQKIASIELTDLHRDGCSVVLTAA